MRKHSNSKQWTTEVEVEAWRAPSAPTVLEQVRKTLAWMWAKMLGQPWDLVRVHVEAEAVALALTRALALAQAEVQARVAAQVEARSRLSVPSKEWPCVQSEAEAEASANAWVRVQAEARGEVEASAWALELAEVHKALRAWMQVLGQAQSLAWQRLSWAPECKMELDHGPWPRRQQDYWWLTQIITPISRLPPELLQHILLIIIDNSNASPLVLMRVCKYWYDIVTGIWASLNLGTTTSKSAIMRKLERNQWLLDVLVDTETNRGHFTPSEDDYQAIFAAMQATSRWRSLVVELFPAQTDLPEDLVNRGLQQCSDPVLSRLRTLTIKRPCEISPLLQHLLRIVGNTASRELTTITINSPTVISFLVPTYSSIFRSVTVLSLDAPGLPNPVDLLPHLHQLEALTISHLPLPVYHDDVDLPFVHTLRHLTLKSVSIQWMIGRTFHVLESCTVLFPLHRHILHTFRTTLPNCKRISFEGYPLDILSGVVARKLTHLSAKCSSSYKPRGDRELALFSSQALQEGRFAPRILHISIEATDEAWTKAFVFMSNLEELVIENTRPSSLGMKVLQSLVVHTSNLGIIATQGGGNIPACPLLKRFGLRYRRWLRPSEHFDLIPVFMSIIQSRQQSKCPLQSFCIWGSGDQKGPLELVDGSQISLEGFDCLASVSAIKGRNL